MLIIDTRAYEQYKKKQELEDFLAQQKREYDIAERKRTFGSICDQIKCHCKCVDRKGNFKCLNGNAHNNIKRDFGYDLPYECEYGKKKINKS